MVRMPAGHLPSQPMEAARLFPEPAAGEPYTILIMPMAMHGLDPRCRRQHQRKMHQFSHVVHFQ
jgi:hypothetical protein